LHPVYRVAPAAGRHAARRLLDYLCITIENAVITILGKYGGDKLSGKVFFGLAPIAVPEIRVRIPVTFTNSLLLVTGDLDNVTLIVTGYLLPIFLG